MTKSTAPHATSSEHGFSLIETMIAMAILATGLLSLAGVFILGLNHLSNSSAALIAREKAREAVESVHTARDTRVITWCQIYNVNSQRGAACATAPAGVFKSGAQPLNMPGPDGLVNTADDREEIEQAVGPGPDMVLGNEDDTHTQLLTYSREIEISEIVTNGVANPNLRRLRVRIRYGKLVKNAQGVLQPDRVYELTTYISAIS